MGTGSMIGAVATTGSCARKRASMRAVAVFAGLAGAFVATPGRADVIYLLNIGNSAISGYAGPYGQVDVHLVDSTDATITFTSDVVGTNEFYFVDGGSVAVNVNATSWTLGTISGDSGSGTYSSGGSGNEDGLGSYNQKVNSPDSNPNNRSTTVTFALTDTSGTWVSDSSVLSADASGNYFAAHIGVCDLTTNTGGCAVTGANLVTTGYAAGALAAAAPEPSTWAMMLAGFAGLGYAAFRRSAKNRLGDAIA